MVSIPSVNHVPEIAHFRVFTTLKRPAAPIASRTIMTSLHVFPRALWGTATLVSLSTYQKKRGSLQTAAPGFVFLNSVRGVASNIGDLGLDSVDDHAMHHYLKAITDWGDKEPDGGF